MNTDKMRRALEIGLDAAIEIANAFHVSHKGYKEDRHEQLDDDVKEIQDVLAALSQSEPEVSQPVAVMWQNEETGNTGFVDLFQVENGFFKNNPRLKQVCFCYSSPPDYEALKAQLVRSDADNTRLQSQYDEMRLKCSRRPAVAENEALKVENNLLKEVENGFADLSENLQKDCAALKTENEELKDDLQFVERWANHHAIKPNVSAQEALSCIQHYPSIRAITKSYKDGAIPTTRNPYAENEALKLRVAELESESRTKHEYAMQMLGERDRLQSECDRSKQRVLELEGVARDSLNALIYHTGQTRPIERTEENIKAIRKTLWEN